MASKDEKERPKIRKEPDEIKKISQKQWSTICRHLSSQPKIVSAKMDPSLTEFQYHLLVKKAKSTRPGVRLRAIRTVRKLFHTNSVLKKDLIDDRIISALVDCLMELENPTLQYEASLAITNACNKECSYTNLVVQNGGIPLLMLVLNLTSSLNVQGQTISALGNIISCSPDLRDSVLDHNFLPRLISFVKPSTTITLLRKVAMIVAYLCETTNPPVAEYVLINLLPVLNQLIKIKDFLIVTDSIYALSNIIDAVDGDGRISDYIFKSEIITSLTELFSNTQYNVIRGAVNVVYRLINKSDKYIQKFMDAGGLFHLLNLLRSTSLKIRKESICIISVVSSISDCHVQEVINAGLIPKVLKYLEFNQTIYSKLRFKTLQLIYNISLKANKQQLDYIIREGVLQPVCHMLLMHEQKYVLWALRTLIIMLCTLHTDNDTFIQFFNKCNGIKFLAPLQHVNEVEEIRKSSCFLVHYISDLHKEKSVKRNRAPRKRRF